MLKLRFIDNDGLLPLAIPRLRLRVALLDRYFHDERSV
jgi:hypothetical protein